MNRMSITPLRGRMSLNTRSTARMRAAGRGRNVHLRDQRLAVDRDGDAVLARVQAAIRRELESDVVGARPDGHVDTELLAVNSVAIQFRVTRSPGRAAARVWSTNFAPRCPSSCPCE